MIPTGRLCVCVCVCVLGVTGPGALYLSGQGPKESGLLPSSTSTSQPPPWSVAKLLFIYLGEYLRKFFIYIFGFLLWLYFCIFLLFTYII